MSIKNQSRVWLWKCLFFTAAWVSGVCISFAQASTPTHVKDSLAEQYDVRGWLERIHQTAQEQSYRGIFVYQHGNIVQASRIVHYAQGKDEYESIESLDGQSHKMLRINDDVYTFQASHKVCIIEQRQDKDTFPALLLTNGSEVDKVYSLRWLGIDRVAGMKSHVVEFVPKDKYRFAYKLWVDKKTYLLLRMQILDARGKVLEQIAFSRIQFGGKLADKNKIVEQTQATKDLHILRVPAHKSIDMAALGWHINPTVPGFRKLHELRRPMITPYAEDPPLEVDQMVFSDGLTAVSVFVEPLSTRVRSEGKGGFGASHMLVKRVGNAWVTLIGEVPQETLQQFLAAIEYRSP